MNTFSPSTARTQVSDCFKTRDWEALKQIVQTSGRQLDLKEVLDQPSYLSEDEKQRNLDVLRFLTPFQNLEGLLDALSTPEEWKACLAMSHEQEEELWDLYQTTPEIKSLCNNTKQIFFFPPLESFISKKRMLQLTQTNNADDVPMSRKHKL